MPHCGRSHAQTDDGVEEKNMLKYGLRDSKNDKLLTYYIVVEALPQPAMPNAYWAALALRSRR